MGGREYHLPVESSSQSKSQICALPFALEVRRAVVMIWNGRNQNLRNASWGATGRACVTVVSSYTVAGCYDIPFSKKAHCLLNFDCIDRHTSTGFTCDQAQKPKKKTVVGRERVGARGILLCPMKNGEFPNHLVAIPLTFCSPPAGDFLAECSLPPKRHTSSSRQSCQSADQPPGQPQGKVILEHLTGECVVRTFPTGFVWKCWVYSQWNSHFFWDNDH